MDCTTWIFFRECICAMGIKLLQADEAIQPHSCTSTRFCFACFHDHEQKNLMFFFLGGEGWKRWVDWVGLVPSQRLGFWKEWSSYLLWYGLGWWFGPSLGRGEIWRVWVVVGKMVDDDESWGISEISFSPYCTSLPVFWPHNNQATIP